MSTDSIARLCYWGGWVAAAIAVVYKLLVTLGIALNLAEQTQVLPHHFWEMGFLLFLISVASTQMARAKSA